MAASLLLGLGGRARHAPLFGVLPDGLLNDRGLADAVSQDERLKECLAVGGDPAGKPEGFGRSIHDSDSSHHVPLVQIMLYLFYRMVDTVYRLVYNVGNQPIKKSCTYMNKTSLTRTLRPRLLLATLVLLCASCTGNWRHLPAIEWRASMALISSGVGAPLEPVFRMVMGGR